MRKLFLIMMVFMITQGCTNTLYLEKQKRKAIPEKTSHVSNTEYALHTFPVPEETVPLESIDSVEVTDFFLVEEPPKIHGGLMALYEYLAIHELYPEMARRAQINGDVIIGFIVDVNGNPRDVYVLAERPAGLGFGEAGIKAIKAMRFTPGYQRDRAVNVRMQQPLKFRLE